MVELFQILLTSIADHSPHGSAEPIGGRAALGGTTVSSLPREKMLVKYTCQYYVRLYNRVAYYTINGSKWMAADGSDTRFYTLK